MMQCYESNIHTGQADENMPDHGGNRTYDPRNGRLDLVAHHSAEHWGLAFQIS